MNEKKLELLLYEEENNTLDFKKEQYKFIGVSNDEKSELLKDILAFANAWRRTDAFILIGVREIKGGKSEIVGITTDLDDASLQQFVNSKTQRPCDFSYQEINTSGGKVCIIKIPVQERPIFLKKDFGKLNKNTVYIRRGSSTDIASPDEIAKMGLAEYELRKEIPQLDLHFFDPINDKLLGKEIEKDLTIIHLKDYDSIPEYRTGRQNLFNISPADIMTNRSYYKDLANYIIFHQGYIDIYFALNNYGSITTEDIRVDMLIISETGNLKIITKADAPSKPDTNIAVITPFKKEISYDIFIEEKNKNIYKVYCSMNKLHAKRQLDFNSSIYIHDSASTNINIQAKIFANELSNPIEQNMVVKLNVFTSEVHWKDIYDKLIKSHLNNV